MPLEGDGVNLEAPMRQNRASRRCPSGARRLHSRNSPSFCSFGRASQRRNATRVVVPSSDSIWRSVPSPGRVEVARRTRGRYVDHRVRHLTDSDHDAARLAPSALAPIEKTNRDVTP